MFLKATASREPCYSQELVVWHRIFLFPTLAIESSKLKPGYMSITLIQQYEYRITIERSD
jgi:hypothetical protein